MEDHLILQMPEYRPVYRDDETYGFKKTREREELKRVLTEAAAEYCMYCYRRLIVSGNYYGNLEHAI